MKKFFKVILPFVKPYRFQAFMNIFSNVIGVVFSAVSITMLIPILSILFQTTEPVTHALPFAWDLDVLKNNFMYFVSQTMDSTDRGDALIFVTGMVVVLFLLKNMFIYMGKFFVTALRVGIVTDIRNTIIHKIVYLPLAYFTESRKGDLIARSTNDVMDIEVSVVSTLEAFFLHLINIIIFMAMLIFMSPQLTIFVLILLPVGAGVIGIVGKSLRRQSVKAQSKLGQVISMLEETLSGLKIIKSLNVEETTKLKFAKENNIYRRTYIKVMRLRELASPLSEFMGIIIMSIVIWYGGSLVLGEGAILEAETFITYLALFSQLIEPGKKFSTAFYDVQKGLASFDRINSILSADISIKSKPNAQRISDFKDEISFEGVGFKYDKDYVLEDINMKVKQGQTIALVGQSGSGKTTMVDLIPRFYDIVAGQICIDGTAITDYDLTDLRHLVGYVNQDPVLFNDTFFNNIALGAKDATMDDVINAAKVANAHDFIMETEQGYNHNIGDRGGKLSGGQRQRISIARAILKNPPILVLDEATSALDTESERLVQDALTKLMENRTSIVIAHRLSTVKHADCIHVMQSGHIIESGKHDDLLAKDGAYKRLHLMQMR